MGIDIYMSHKLIDKEAQFTGFDVTAGRTGYLREAYHGGPYATQVLVPEAFGADYESGGFPFSARVLRARLPETLLAVAERGRRVYGENYDEGHPILRSFIEFVELAERVEAESGVPVRIYASY
jgi:hypothetical protein